MRAAVAIVLAAAVIAARPGAAAAQATERERIVAERNAISAFYSQQEAACAQHFAATACVEDVQARHREALAPLRARELSLDEAGRRRRAAERSAAIEAKQQAAARRPLPPPAASAASVAHPRRLDAPMATPAPAVTTRPSRAPDAGAARSSEAAARAQAALRRQEAVRATQDRIAKRLAERAKDGRRVTPLPSPAASAAQGAGRANGASPAQR